MFKIVMMMVLPLWVFAGTFNPEIQGYIDRLKQEVRKSDSSFTDFDVARGEQIFTSTHVGKKGENISCVSCHTQDLRTNGKNVHTGKILDPLAPSANPVRLTKLKDVEKWLRRNFNDVYVREGTALERGDVLYYINSK